MNKKAILSHLMEKLSKNKDIWMVTELVQDTDISAAELMRWGREYQQKADEDKETSGSAPAEELILLRKF